MGRRRLFQLSARYKRRLVKTPSEIFEENFDSDLVQAERENIYSEQVFEEDLEEIEVGNAVAAHPRTPNYPDEGTVDEEIQKSLKKVADRVGKRMRYKYILSIITVAKDFRNNIKIVINSYMFIEFKTKSRRLTGEIDIRFSIDSLSNRRTFPFDISSNLSRKLEIRGEFDIDSKANVISKHKRIQSELLSGA
ncbi:hypothetical protein Fcan01_22898 [Folsomia candida]|uniref:Uncharacterized protein n=1 Tax=Folsomia candida TaxID=158441 RepID=A0A226DD20_FOLCA|nr:hypothetical protein Fcan01_22898 [Folsomia candida]